MGAATARPEITTLISVFSIPAACFHPWLAREPRSRSGNMLELTFGVRCGPAPSAPMPPQVLAGQTAADEGRPAWSSASSWLWASARVGPG